MKSIQISEARSFALLYRFLPYEGASNVVLRVRGDSADHNGDLVSLPRHELRKLLHGHRGPVAAGRVQPLEDHLVELGVCTPSQELVEPAEQADIRVVGGGDPGLGLLAASGFQVNTHGGKICVATSS